MEEANVHSTPGKSRKTVLQRKASRAKEKLFQTLGKADKTRDEGFETYVGNFAKQQASANNLSKEIRRYVSSVKAMEMSAKSLYDALAEVHEPEWVEHNVIEEASQKSLEIWVDYMKTLQDSVVEPMTQYQAKFTDVRQRIDKRGRKLVDFDSARHHFNSLQHSKRQDDYKILKSHSELLEAKDLFDDINSTMYEQLPELYDSRIQTYVQLFQAIFNADTALHGQSAQLVQTLHQALGKLQVETAEGTYNCPRFEPVLPPTPTTPLSRATTPASTLRTPVLVGNSNKTPDAAIGVYDVARPANGPENNGPSTSVGIPDSPKTLTLTSNGHDGQAVNGRQHIQLGKREIIVETTTRYRTIGRPPRGDRLKPSAFCTLPRGKPERPLQPPSVHSADPGRRKVETMPARGRQADGGEYWRTKEPIPWHPEERAAWQQKTSALPRDTQPPSRPPGYKIPEEPPIRRPYTPPWAREAAARREAAAPLASAPKREPYSYRSEERSYEKREKTTHTSGTVAGSRRPDGSVAPLPWRPRELGARKTDASPYRSSDRPSYWLMDEKRRAENLAKKEEPVKQPVKPVVQYEDRPVATVVCAASTTPVPVKPKRISKESPPKQTGKLEAPPRKNGKKQAEAKTHAPSALVEPPTNKTDPKEITVLCESCHKACTLKRKLSEDQSLSSPKACVGGDVVYLADDDVANEVANLQDEKPAVTEAPDREVKEGKPVEVASAAAVQVPTSRVVEDVKPATEAEPELENEAIILAQDAAKQSQSPPSEAPASASTQPAEADKESSQQGSPAAEAQAPTQETGEQEHPKPEPEDEEDVKAESSAKDVANAGVKDDSEPADVPACNDSLTPVSHSESNNKSKSGEARVWIFKPHKGVQPSENCSACKWLFNSNIGVQLADGGSALKWVISPKSPKREDESGEVAVTNEDVKAVESHPPADAPVCNDSAAEVAAVKPENEEEKEKVDVGESLEESITATLMATSLTDDKKAADDDTPAEEQQGAVVNVAMTPENAEVAVSMNQVEQPPQMAAPTQNTEQPAAAGEVKEDVKPHDGVKMDVWQETTEVTHGDTHQSTQVTETTSVMKAEEGVSVTQETREVITKVITNTEDLGEKVAEKAEEKVEEVTQKVDDITQKVDDVTQKVEEVMQKVDDVTQKVEEVTQKVEDVTQKKVDDEYVPPGTLYTVVATHDYWGEDDDELNFEMGEDIYVVEFENPEEQDEGWLMGVVKSSRKKGVFPENFTSKKV